MVLFLADLVSAWCGVDPGLWDGGVWSFVMSGGGGRRGVVLSAVDFEAANRFLRSGRRTGGSYVKWW
ncbi:hypothetical protein [Streptomyces lydicus]|uniref:hypothetical protein n=1 Tax=Streptomyces lydicus TaxID=47763 RepID=UPI000B07C0E2|nr:hypothetical protein [Streptomyces lydicus]MDC7339800.1 hypothetical protein [Streptomyces lydicus]UEG95758.1 hypothetical protein LJ741_08580 [Streptomyces lydicus]